MKRRTNRIAAAILAAVVLLCAAWLLHTSQHARHGVATIWVDGAAERTLPLDKDTAFSITTPEGHALSFEIKDGRIRFTASDCPDKICVHTGFIGSETQTAVCMPNRVSITIQESP